jgi:ATP-dependent HslUV protease ATP-binding subunit HslU
MHTDLTPIRIVEQLDRYIVGQSRTKRIVAIALRNRLRRRRLDPKVAQEVVPKNILMMGPTGVGKTEIARRLAQLVNAPFLKVEATKFTEVGYVGRDVESMVRELVETAISLIRSERMSQMNEQFDREAKERILDLLLPPLPGMNGSGGGRSSSLYPERRGAYATSGMRGGSSGSMAASVTPPTASPSEGAGGAEGGAEGEIAGANFVMRNVEGDFRGATTTTSTTQSTGGGDPAARWERSREKLAAQLDAGELDERTVEVEVNAAPSIGFLGGAGMEEMGIDMRGMFERMMPRQSRLRRMTVAEARDYFRKEAAEDALDQDEIAREALDRAAEDGIIFIDEFDKIAGRRGEGSRGGPDVSREGVQRDILPIVEGSSVMTKYGIIKTDHILFVAAGAFSISKPSDLIPELQGRFPLRCELEPLTRDDFRRILIEPENSLTAQYVQLLATDGVGLEITDDAIDAVADAAAEINERLENIGARRLHTILERVLEEVSFEAPDARQGHVRIDGDYVRHVVNDLIGDEDLERYVL